MKSESVKTNEMTAAFESTTEQGADFVLYTIFSYRIAIPQSTATLLHGIRPGKKGFPGSGICWIANIT